MTHEPISMNTTQAAKLLGVTRTTLMKWVEAGKLPSYKIGDAKNSIVLVATDDVYALIGKKPDGSPLTPTE